MYNPNESAVKELRLFADKIEAGEYFVKTFGVSAALGEAALEGWTAPMLTGDITFTMVYVNKAYREDYQASAETVDFGEVD